MTKNNVFKIDLEQVYYEFDLGVATVKFSKADENIRKLIRNYEQLREDFRVYENLKEEEITDEKFEEVLQLVRKAWNDTFEGATFDDVYEKVPSLFVLVDAFGEMIYKVKEQEKINQYKNKSDRAKEYVKNKRK